MFKNLRISTKITALIVALATAGVLAFALVTHRVNVKAEQDKLNASVTAVADQQVEMFNHYFDHVNTTVKFLQGSAQLRNQIAASPDSLAASLQHIKSIYSFAGVYITDKRGTVVTSTEADTQGRNLADLDINFFSNAASSIQVSGVRKDGDKYFIYVGSGIGNKVIAFKLDLDPIYQKLLTGNIGATGESYLGQIDPATKKIIIVSPLRNDPKTFLKTLETGSRASQEMQSAIDGKNGSSVGPDYRHIETLKVFRKINQSGWGLVVKIDIDEIQNQSANLSRVYLFGGLAVILLAWGAALMLGRTLVKPLNDMGHTLDLVSQGVLPENIATGSRDEFGKMADKVNSLVQTLKSSAEFAKNVGEGKLDAHFQPVSENDTLGQALIHMRVVFTLVFNQVIAHVNKRLA